MQARDFNDTVDLHRDEDLERFFCRRFVIEGAQANSFWLSHVEEYPCMLVLVKGDLATLWYTPRMSHPGYVSVGRNRRDDDGTTTFYFDRDPQETRNDLTIACARAMQAAKEFMHSDELPSAIEWMELRSQ